MNNSESSSTREHPLTASLLRRRVSKNVRPKIRRRFDQLAKPPHDIEAWLDWELKRRNEDLLRQAAIAREKEERRRLVLPRLQKWEILARAAGKINDRTELHPLDELELASERTRIFELRQKRKRLRQVRNSLPGVLHHRLRVYVDLRIREEKKAAAAARRKRLVIERRTWTRKKNRILKKSPYGRFLLELESAQVASDRAKTRAANGIHFDDYRRVDSSDYVRANYRRSRWARERDYREKEWHIDEACKLAEECQIPFGWQQDGAGQAVAWVVYFDMPSGQVSFHCPERGSGPTYETPWNGQSGVSEARIHAAIVELVNEVQGTTRADVVLRDCSAADTRQN